MKKIFKFVKIHAIFILFCVICVVFLPNAVVAQPQSRTKLVVRAIGVDKNDSGYEVSAIVFIPKATQTFSENYQVVSGKGNSFYEAFSNIGIETGREVALSHTSVIYVNDKICQEGLVESLDYLIRDYSLNNSSNLVYVEKSAKEIVEASKSVIQNSGVKIGDVAKFDEDKVVFLQSNIESLFSSAYSKSGCAMINIMELSDEMGLESSGSPEESGGAQSGGGNENKSKKILNEGKSLVLKNGKKALVLDKDETSALRFGKKLSQIGYLELNNFSNENFKDAHLAFIIEKNIVKYTPTFKNGKPVLEIKIMPKLRLAEVNQKTHDEKIFLGDPNIASESLVSAVNEKVKTDFSSVLTKLKNKNLDVLSAYEKFNASSHAEFQKFLSSLENPNAYYQNIELEIQVAALVV